MQWGLNPRPFCLESSTEPLCSLPGPDMNIKVSAFTVTQKFFYTNSNLYFQFNLHHQVAVKMEEEKSTLAVSVGNNSWLPPYLSYTREHIQERNLTHVAPAERALPDPITLWYMREYILERNLTNVKCAINVLLQKEICGHT